MPLEVRKNIRFVLTDVDGTLTHNGHLEVKAYAALAALRNSGKKVVAVTGRSAGWCDHMARMWPVEGVVGENGAFYFRYDARSCRMIRRFLRSEEQRRKDMCRLSSLTSQVLQMFPGCALASDQHYRETDLAIDFCEDVRPLPLETAKAVLEFFRDAGFEGKISSIHVNVWCGDYSKLTTSRLFFKEVFATDMEALLQEALYIGDSPNDEPMFGFFPHSVGVANILKFPDMQTCPRYMTPSRGGRGFSELSAMLVAAADVKHSASLVSCS